MTIPVSVSSSLLFLLDNFLSTQSSKPSSGSGSESAGLELGMAGRRRLGEEGGGGGLDGREIIISYWSGNGVEVVESSRAEKGFEGFNWKEWVRNGGVWRMYMALKRRTRRDVRARGSGVDAIIVGVAPVVREVWILAVIRYRTCIRLASKLIFEG